MLPMITRSPKFVVHLALLLFAGALGRGWLIAHTAVPARDGIGFINYALRLQSEPWQQVIRESHHPPGFPGLILFAGQIAAWWGIPLTPDCWVLTAQCVAAVAATLAVVPLYLTGRLLFGPTAGFLAAWIFQSLPVCLQVTSDVLSEGVFLFFAAWAMYWGVLSVSSGSSLAAILCGISAGAGYGTRPEGIELAITSAMSLVLAGAIHRQWKRFTVAILAVLVGLLPFVLGYCHMTGRFSNKPTAQQILGSESAAIRMNCTSGPVIAAFWDPEVNAGQSRALWAFQSVVKEATHTAHGFGLVAALVAVVWFRQRLRGEPALWFPIILMTLHLGVLWRMAMVVGYVSQRHALLAILGACLLCGGLFASWGRSWRCSIWMWSALFLFVGWAVALKPLHGQRIGYREAGRWLATQIRDGDEIIDPSAWARFYAGQMGVFSPDNHLLATGRQFVVLELRPGGSRRLHLLPWAEEIARFGQPVFRWPSDDNARIVIYQVTRGS
jgi:hypothetical protein